jgi:hypothetical protein
MSRTIEGIVDAHRVASERRAAGRPIWDERVNLRDVFHNEAMTFEERRDVIVARLRRSRWVRGMDEYDAVPQLLEELAETSDGDEFDGPWDEIYDYADADRVWIGTS